MADQFSEPEALLAERLDAEISQILAGVPARNADPAVTWIASAMHADPPASLAVRVAAEHERRERTRWRPVQVVAAVFAMNLLSHGLGNMVVGAWVSRGLGEHYSPHASREGGIALIAVGLAVGAGALRRSWLPVSVAAGVPLGVALGIYGLPEVGQFAAGAALHLTQGTLGVLLGITWWRAHRYDRHPKDEGEA